jgi:hypothetical protein
MGFFRPAMKLFERFGGIGTLGVVPDHTASGVLERGYIVAGAVNDNRVHIYKFISLFY